LFIYCKSVKLIAEADSDGNITKKYVYLEGNIFAHFLYDFSSAAPTEPAAGNGPYRRNQQSLLILLLARQYQIHQTLLFFRRSISFFCSTTNRQREHITTLLITSVRRRLLPMIPGQWFGGPSTCPSVT
jgi:hypothetical protein